MWVSKRVDFLDRIQMLSSNTILLVCFGIEIDWPLFSPGGIVLCNDLAKIFEWYHLFVPFLCFLFPTTGRAHVYKIHLASCVSFSSRYLISTNTEKNEIAWGNRWLHVYWRNYYRINKTASVRYWLAGFIECLILLSVRISGSIGSRTICRF